jgi:hypothetical protein
MKIKGGQQTLKDFVAVEVISLITYTHWINNLKKQTTSGHHDGWFIYESNILSNLFFLTAPIIQRSF